MSLKFAMLRCNDFQTKFEICLNYESHIVVSLYTSLLDYICTNPEHFSCRLHEIYRKYSILIKNFVVLQRCKLSTISATLQCFFTK